MNYILARYKISLSPSGTFFRLHQPATRSNPLDGVTRCTTTRPTSVSRAAKDSISHDNTRLETPIEREYDGKTKIADADVQTPKTRDRGDSRIGPIVSVALTLIPSDD